MDGAMGTELQRAGINEGECYELWNLTRPAVVGGIHERYVAAGAEVLLTNTFQARAEALARHRLAEKQAEIMAAAIALARAAAGPQRWVVAALGPVGPKADRAVEARRLLAAAADADAILLETQSDLADLEAIAAARDQWADTAPPLFVSFTFRRGPAGQPETIHGRSPAQCARHLERFGVAALGVNCGRDIDADTILAIVRGYRDNTGLPLFARPNAGTPRRAGVGRWEYPLSPTIWAEGLARVLDARVAMIGGCCGTTPEHIAALRRLISPTTPDTAPRR
ncbi:MAG: homocysteine S-methyltransferase family protein [Gemmataceae bacterium]|nr:homocysteine S-methyltransferase family protein [Gemmataceae bacterium]MDW8267025.1 homocysteine S-methyltransferase family protein [Gemmataceae bacterium]